MILSWLFGCFFLIVNSKGKGFDGARRSKINISDFHLFHLGKTIEIDGGLKINMGQLSM